jgi:hypothetical protein
MAWGSVSKIGTRKYICGHCSESICAEIGYTFGDNWQYIYICHNCNKPTYFYYGGQVPGPMIGSTIKNVPDDIGKLYDEARKSYSVSAFTASIMACRKLVMHIAVSRGATEGLSFQKYVEYLSEKGFIPPDGKEWVDHIRTKGNEANHEIVIMGQNDAEDLIIFIEGLLRFIYEFPSRLKAKTPSVNTPKAT